MVLFLRGGLKNTFGKPVEGAVTYIPWIWNTELSRYIKLFASLRLQMRFSAVPSIFWCQNKFILLLSHVFKELLLKFKHQFFKFKGFSRRKSFAPRSLQGTVFSKSSSRPCANHLFLYRNRQDNGISVGISTMSGKCLPFSWQSQPGISVKNVWQSVEQWQKYRKDIIAVM